MPYRRRAWSVADRRRRALVPGDDGQPVIDQIPGLDNAWVSAGHDGTGLLLAPAAGRALAAWIASGRRPTEIDSLALARFAQP